MKKFRPGISFGDFVVTDSKRGKVHRTDEIAVDYRRGFAVWLAVLVVFGILIVRMLNLQVYQGTKFRILADENRIKRIKVNAVRGDIVDRFGKVLAGSQVEGEKWQRVYPEGKATAHVVGYLGEIGEEEVGLLRPPAATGGRLDMGDVVGRTGMELVWDEQIRGQDGGRLVEVDSNGGEVRNLGNQVAVAGEELKLTLDLALQETGFQALQGFKGAVVAANPKNGEVYVMVSTPSYDPNKVSDQFAVTSNQVELPFLNRAIGGVYPPGSTFKMVTTVAAIEDKRVKPTFTYEDVGVVTVGDFSYTNWYFTANGRTEGVVGFRRALARSTDTFFYKVGEQTGAVILAKWASKLGLGEKTGIELLDEVEGLIATPEWKERVKKEQWFLGNTYHMAIGQGDMLVTPLQVNVMTNVIAANGIKCETHLIKSQIPNPKSQGSSNDPSSKCLKIDIAQDTLDLVHQGMLEACSEGGTAYPFFEWNKNQSIKVACKTGTAEYVLPSGKIGLHAWLTAYAPADDPTISVTVLVEAGGEGSRTAAPVVRKIMAKYFGVEDKFDYVTYAKGPGGGE